MKKTQIKGNKCGRARKSLLFVTSIILVISSGIFLWMYKTYEYRSNENIKQGKQNTAEIKRVITNQLSSQTMYKTVLLQKVIVEQSSGTSNDTSKQNSSDKFMEQVEQAIFEKVNQERVKAGVAKLSYSSTMEKYSRIKSKDMGDRGYFNHTDPEGNLITAKMKKDGVRYRTWGENIAYIGGISNPNTLANQFMINWMNSPGHKANILSKEFKELGIGVYKVNNKTYATQEFFR